MKPLNNTRTEKAMAQLGKMRMTAFCLLLAAASWLLWTPSAFSETTGHHETQAHEDEPGASDHDDHDDHEEGGSSVGPDKGIIEANETKGIRLAPQAIQNFGIRTVALKGAAPWKVPTSATLHALEEVNLYRLRDGFFKRVDFTVTKRASKDMTVLSRELKDGDEIVTDGVGFLRIAELTAFGGAPEGHSH